MLRTHEELYAVRSCHTSYLWLEVLEGDDQGIRVSIPIYHDEYDDETTEQLRSLTEGDVVNAVLKSDTDASPNWRVETLSVKHNAR